MAGVPSLARLVLLAGCLLVLADAARLPASLAADADALLQLKSGIKNDTDALRSWSPGTSPCDGDASNWAGVMCNKDGVHGLQLEKMGFSGTLDLLPLKSLRGLRTLSFMDNEFAGPMPDIKELGGLRAIFLSGNKFSGEIPADAFAGMGSLKKVFLSKNSFSGPIPASLAEAPRLLELQLNDNKFQGKIPDFPQKELKEVNLANNELEGEIPANLKSMKTDMLAGNKKLCGAPLNSKCEAPSSPPPKSSPPTSDKIGTQTSPPAPHAATSTGGPSADDAAQNARAPTEGSTAPGVLAAFLGTLAIIGIAFVALQRRRQYNTKNFGPAVSTKTSMPPKIEPHPPPKDARAAHVAPSGGGDDEDRSRRVGGSTVRKVEQGRLTFVRDGSGRFFELQDLLKATAEVLGIANLGVCYRATLTSGHSVVVKRFKEMNRVSREDFEEHMRRLGRLSHPNLLPLVAYYYRKEEKLLIHDYVPNRSLANLFHGEGRGLKKAVVHWTARLKIVKGVARALNYLYDELCMLTVPHGHLKSSNILLDGHFEPLLTDYAFVPVMNQSHAAQLMVAFKSPERKQFGRSSKKSDVWCLGLLILEILTGRPATYDPPKAMAPGTEQQQQPEPAAGNDLLGVVSSTPEGEWLDTVVDPDLRNEEDENKEEMVKLIRIGMACCEGNVESRWELKTAIERIEELKGKELANEEYSFYSSVNDEDFSNVAIN
ncbi:probable LRR receptor-like serine/threonine-protein kinase At4g31250 [Phragmites australis]|uniref:probable LRR receptor-like serine/threonine-protein kinase At4g31250 n=1 Tax=Phragmites australis TaxID=29695 RepID=UPI002D7A2287|nr:probable LRR receptor-like serine/threonine-protein kinase At4g31250 [Phragmites australis]